jgi:hypothetical protein
MWQGLPSPCLVRIVRRHDTWSIHPVLSLHNAQAPDDPKERRIRIRRYEKRRSFERLFNSD